MNIRWTTNVRPAGLKSRKQTEHRLRLTVSWKPEHGRPYGVVLAPMQPESEEGDSKLIYPGLDEKAVLGDQLPCHTLPIVPGEHESKLEEIDWPPGAEFVMVLLLYKDAGQQLLQQHSEIELASATDAFPEAVKLIGINAPRAEQELEVNAQEVCAAIFRFVAAEGPRTNSPYVLEAKHP